MSIHGCWCWDEHFLALSLTATEQRHIQKVKRLLLSGRSETIKCSNRRVSRTGLHGLQRFYPAAGARYLAHNGRSHWKGIAVKKFSSGRRPTTVSFMIGTMLPHEQLGIFRIKITCIIGDGDLEDYLQQVAKTRQPQLAPEVPPRVSDCDFSAITFRLEHRLTLVILKCTSAILRPATHLILYSL